MFFGGLLKQIRIERNIKQKELSDGIVSRSTISKIENGTHEPSFETAMKLINRLGISLSDFERRYMGEKSNSALEAYFKNIDTQAPHSFHLRKIANVQATRNFEENAMTENIYMLSDALWRRTTTDRHQLQETIQAVWNKFQLVENWNRTDLYVLNDLIAFLPVKVAENVAKLGIDKISHEYPELIALKASFLNNLGLLLLLDDAASESEQVFDESIRYAKLVHRYDIALTAHVRKALARKNDQEVNKYVQIIATLEDIELLDSINHEITEIKNTI